MTTGVPVYGVVYLYSLSLHTPLFLFFILICLAVPARPHFLAIWCVVARFMSKPPRTVKVVQFSGTYLNKQWTRRFILGTLLQRYDAARLRDTGGRAGGRSDAALLRVQRLASDVWQLPAKPLDPVSERRIFRLLARYACGEGALSDEALRELRWVLRALPDAPAPIDDPRQVERLLGALHYVEPGDNLRRLSYAGALHYPPQAHALMEPHLAPRIQRDGGDPFDPIREVCDGPGYAIDSATTSEVDDAIGLEVDPATGAEVFTVYVSDATVYCPFDSALEQVTARLLTTTTYLPEGVFFMLPKPIVEAATLREDRPCRTFNIRFQVHPATGELHRYSVHVGWLRRLRRITYDQVQALLTPDGAGGAPPPPAWLQPQDAQRIKRIHEVARLRFAARMRRSDAGGRAVEANLPEPLIRVAGTRVVSVADQILSTQDARLAVAELMIAANEVCSRVGQAHGIALPYRGTRSLSTDHQVAKYFAEPQGVATAASLDRGTRFMAEAIVRTVRRLSAVTRAIYHHAPLHHAGLDTTFYTHSTSPLRRYADMLVHHQLKVLLWAQHKSAPGGRRHTAVSMSDGGSARPPPLFALPPIAEHTMASLCQMISNKQQQSSLLQDSSSRFWILRFMSDLLARDPRRRFVCLVGDTRRVAAAPAYRPAAAAPFDGLLAALQPPRGDAAAAAAEAPAAPCAYVSDLYLPELQFTHTVPHHNAEVRVGALVDCEVTAVLPTQGLLEMRVVAVRRGIDERQGERLWMGSAVSVLDA
ncbi:mitochondrial exoribonuclease DSS-1 [Strigomonas culicis]|uniref:Mitochondrial exoribonuclease DSS-1 n=1 Tax=Strigomonas culicis TaxID=28005 RepID=S9VL55_9TRYP|nr:mitochondrial exoribonuclease DSS-1 [Strigomonas culicis]|eukprot:EPY27851.1 mitochondrial exoribonuclease DSS-1 [Strigomonas culicis]